MGSSQQTSIVVPCRNEAGTIESLLSSILHSISSHDEVIIVEGGSFDATWDVVSKFAKKHPQVSAIQQSGKGKFDAVIEGINFAKKDYIMIWDADGTVSFADNLKILNFNCEEPYMLTGDRLRGLREKDSMQFFNYLGNWFFAILWGLLLRRRPLDTLCGTKKFPSNLLEGSPKWLISNDPYGDFSILAMARIKDIEVLSIAVDYSARKYGKTNIHRWSGGYMLLKLIIRIASNKGHKR